MSEPGVRGRGAAAPFLDAARGRCPNCGQGALFTGFLGIASECPACGCDLSKADTGDGPAVFVILIGGMLAGFGLLFTEVLFRPPIWVDLVVWLPVAAILCLALLRPLKGLMVAAQFVNHAAEVRRDDL